MVHENVALQFNAVSGLKAGSASVFLSPKCIAYLRSPAIRLFLAGNTMRRPGQHLQAPSGDLLFAFQADPERSFFESLKRPAYLAQQRGVGIERADYDLPVHLQLQIIERIGGILDPNVFPTPNAAQQFPMLCFQSSPDIRLFHLMLYPWCGQYRKILIDFSGPI
jgi:hypothetical protein